MHRKKRSIKACLYKMLEELQLAPTPQRVLKFLIHNSQADPSGRYDPVARWRQADIAAALGLSERTVRRVLRYLEDAKLIRLKTRARRGTGKRGGRVGSEIFLRRDIFIKCPLLSRYRPSQANRGYRTCRWPPRTRAALNRCYGDNAGVPRERILAEFWFFAWRDINDSKFVRQPSNFRELLVARLADENAGWDHADWDLEIAALIHEARRRGDLHRWAEILVLPPDTRQRYVSGAYGLPFERCPREHVGDAKKKPAGRRAGGRSS